MDLIKRGGPRVAPFRANPPDRNLAPDGVLIRDTDSLIRDRVLHREQQGVTFALEDGSGRAIVDPDGAELERKGGYAESWGFLSKPTPLARAFLESRGVDRQGLVFNRDLSFREEIVEVGESICIAGAGVREPDPEAEVGEGYRLAPPTRLRFTSSPKFRILITDAPPEP